MGTVWRARDVGLHREVAIKEVRPADAAMVENSPALAEQQRERVLRESRALARLQHPNVVSIYQIIESDDSPYPWIVMELVRGMSLEDRLREGALSPVEAACIGRGVLGALRAAHAAGILHRDVKPGNVLLRPDGSAVLTDFGIAALHDSTQLTATGEVIGSPEYMAPERLLGDETKTASDLWSLAMLLYVGVEGHHPLRRATTMATLAAVMTDQVPPPRRAGALGPALSAVLVSDPNARPTGEQLDRMLAAAEAGDAPTLVSQPFPAQPTATWHPHQPVHRPGRNRTGVAVFAVTTLALVVVAALVVIPRLGSGDDPTDTGSRSPGTETSTTSGVPNIGDQATPTPPKTTTTTVAAKTDLLTPDGARTAVAALSEVMGGTRVSDLTIYAEFARAIGPTTSVRNGFDKFEYRDGTATREGADGVDANRATLDLDSVNWDALPALWARAEKDLGVAEPTLRYVIVDTDIIDETPSVRIYLSDDYGGAYLIANLAGEVVKLYPRDS
jgi:serine/threonine protein kinase